MVLANQVIQPSTIRKLAHLAGQARLTVCADNADNLRALSKACAIKSCRMRAKKNRFT